jgi:sigma-B regulation protein RsbU (phosphoserine phosphatase)
MNAQADELLFERRFPAQADRMAAVRETVRSAARLCGFDDQTAQDIVLAVGEACQNVILHSYGDRDDGQILLDIRRGGDRMVLRVVDFGPPVDPQRIRPRDLQDVRPGGLGTHFIQQLMDSADFGPAPDGKGNVLQMTKKKVLVT